MHRPAVLFALSAVIWLLHTPAAIGQKSSSGRRQDVSSVAPKANALTTNFNIRACHSRLRNYVEFHKSTKGTPDAKYMVYSCTQRHCAGLGESGFRSGGWWVH